VSLVEHIALVSVTKDISMRDLLQCGAAVQKQLTRDFAPIWGMRATLDSFTDLASVPSDYHPIVIFGYAEELVGQVEEAIGPEYTAKLVDDFERGRLTGLHLNAFTRQPFSLVQATDAWSVTVSHEALEMRADRYGNHLIAAAHPTNRGERVKYLLEVCDPCQQVWYPVNGVPVSDFYTPRYFEPVAIPGGRYSYTGSIEEPLQILPGGYVTWIDPEDSSLYTLNAGDDTPVKVANLLQLARSTAPLRTVVDAMGHTPKLTLDSIRPAETAVAAGSAYDAVAEASEGAGLRTAEAVWSLATGAG
jgi:hypothetical protein